MAEKTSAEIQAEIEACEREMAELRPQLDQASETVSAAAKAALPHFFDEWMKRTVKEKAAEIEKVKERLPELKREFRAFIESLPSLIDEYMPTPSGWPHRRAPVKPISSPYYSEPSPSNDQLGDDFAKAALHSVTSNFGSLLSGYGIIKVAYSGEQGYHYWVQGSKGPRYNQYLNFPTEVLGPIKAYGVIFRSYEQIQSQSGYLVFQKSRASATELWDEA